MGWGGDPHILNEDETVASDQWPVPGLIELVSAALCILYLLHQRVLFTSQSVLDIYASCKYVEKDTESL